MTPTDTATVELTLPDAPAIPGLRFRRFRDASDWAPLADLQKAVAIADQDDEIQSPENLRIDVENKPGFVIARDLLIAEVDGQIVGARRWHRHDPRRLCPSTTSSAASIPTGGGAGIGRALFRWNERRAATARSPSRSSPAQARSSERGQASSSRAPRPSTSPRVTRSCATPSR